jgi:alpha-tubulin suppressor-like RCC1 family protein
MKRFKPFHKRIGTTPALGRKLLKQNLLILAICVVVVSGLATAYAALSATLLVDGQATIRESQPVRIATVAPTDPQPSCGVSTYPPTWDSTSFNVDGMLPALDCTIAFNITVKNETDDVVFIKQIVEDSFHDSAYMEYSSSITPSSPSAVVSPQGKLDFTIKFRYRESTASLPSLTSFVASFHLVFEIVTAPILAIRGDARNFEFFRGNTATPPSNLYGRVVAVDDMDGNITANIQRTCSNASGQVVTCPTTWADRARGDYDITFNVTNSLGLAAVPVALHVKLWDFTKLDSGTYHTVALTSNGKFYTWGYNAGYRQGLNDTTRRTSPVLHPLSNSAYIVDVAACDHTGHAVDSNGNLWSWGSSTTHYTLGTGNNDDQRVPINIGHPSGENYVKVACRYSTGLALTDAGNVYSWGESTYGANGLGNVSNVRIPTKVTGLTNIVGISMGEYNGLAVGSNGVVYNWGSNYYGQLGAGDSGSISSKGITNYYNLPSNYSGVTNVKMACMGQRHAVVVLNNGQVVTWGNNSDGRVGNGTSSTNAYSPYTTNITGGATCAVNEDTSSVITTGGTGYFFGDNGYGKAGTGSTSPSSVTTPTAISKTGLTYSANQLNSSHVLADGIITWAFGYNNNGELGIGTTSNTSTITAWDFTAPAVREW